MKRINLSPVLRSPVYEIKGTDLPGRKNFSYLGKKMEGTRKNRKIISGFLSLLKTYK